MKYEIEDFLVDVGNLKIKCRPWTSKEERMYLTRNNDEEKSENLKNVAKMLILPNIEFQPITLSEFKFLVLSLRSLSVDTKASLNVSCSCGQFIEFDSLIKDLTHFKESEIDGKVIKSGNLELELRRIPTKELLLKVLETDDELEQKFNEFLACIKSITYKGEKNSVFTFEELKEFFDGVPSNIFNDLFSEFYKVKGHLQLFQEVTCPVCRKKFDAVFRDIDNFL